MVRFDEMLDGIISTTKNVVKAAGQKTSEVVEIGKLKYQEQSLIRDIEKAYAKLGAIVYEATVNGEELDGLMDLTIDEITDLNEQLDAVEQLMVEVKEDSKIKVEEEPLEDISIVVEPVEDVEEILTDREESSAKEPIELFPDTVEETIENEADAIVDEIDEMADDIIAKLDTERHQEDND